MLYLLLDHSINEIDVNELSEMGDDVVLLDAREANEYNVSHIENAKNVGHATFSLDSVSGIEKDKKIVIYCSLGKRSENIAKQLVAAGYTDVSNLYGGIFEWKNRGFSVYNNSLETEKVHAYDKVFGVWLTKGEKVFD
ncbi:MAG: rhodanese-like domain-containing protein [Flavobacteriales bacterium]|nr:rhodanese-like domain-containing protein [Flavobacteriales bacterium]